MAATDFDHPPESDDAAWRVGGQLVCKQYERRVRAIQLKRTNGVIVLEPYAGDPDNAVIFNEDGSLTARVENPLRREEVLCFADVFYSRLRWQCRREHSRCGLRSIESSLGYGCEL